MNTIKNHKMDDIKNHKIKSSIGKKINKAFMFCMLFCIILISASGIAFGAECSGTLSAPTKSLYVGEQFDINFFNAEATSNGMDVNLTLSPNLATLDTNPQAGIPFTTNSWTVNSSATGNLLSNVKIIGLCEKNFTIKIINQVEDPNIEINLSEIPELTLGTSHEFNVTLNNTGLGNATEISGILSTATNSAIIPDSFSNFNLEPNTSKTDSYMITPTQCGTDTLTILVNNYKNENSELMVPVLKEATYSVTGSDIAFTTISAENNFKEGENFEVNFTIENLKNINASDIIVNFYKNESLLGSKSINLLVANNQSEHTISLSGDSFHAGNHTLKASIESLNECSSKNNEIEFEVTNIVGGTCSDKIKNGDETGTDCGGSCSSSCTPDEPTIPSGNGGSPSGSGNTIKIELSEDLPSVTVIVYKSDTVKLIFEDKPYYLNFDKLYANKGRITLRLPGPDTVKMLDEDQTLNVDINKNGTEDIGITMEEINTGKANIKFELLSAKKITPNIIPMTSKKVDSEVNTTESDKPDESQLKEAKTDVKESFSEGILSFIETFSVRSKAPVFGGIALSLAIIVLGLGIYFVISRKKE
ncbi:hypothetical protein HN587_00485 [Candidatus Woesearchaeota archaeon]|jgi:hypothetical protein|nr:hypothetical protein [Candidatus Woesearchaeota archaeon]